MFLHLFYESSPIFNSEFVWMIQSSFDIDEHHFVFAHEGPYHLVQGIAACELDTSILNLGGTIRQIKKYDHVFFHSLPFSLPKLLLFRVGRKQLLKKCSWITWGHDLYYEGSRYKTANYIINKIRPYSIHQLQSFIAGFKGDIDYFQVRYKSPKLVFNAVYPMGYDLKQFTIEDYEKKDSLINIMIGHSAIAYSQHEKWFELLEPYKENVRLILICAYGVKEYADRIKECVKTKFSHYIIYDKLVNQAEYIQILNQVDCAVFDFNKQAAFGNILLLMYLKKKLYLSKTGIMYKTFIKEKLSIYPCSQLVEDIKQMENGYNNNVELDHNKKWAENYLLEENVVKQWENVFSSIKEKI